MRPKWYAVIIVSIAVMVAGICASKYAWRVACLRWAKQKVIVALTADRALIDQTPGALSLGAPPHGTAVDSVEFGRHRAWFFKPDSRQEKEKWVDLQYARFRVRVLTPMEYKNLDEMAKQFGMKDRFAVLSAAHHATAKGVETQPDIASVKRQALLIELKTVVMVEGSETYYAQFDGVNVRGFIAGDISKGNRRVLAEVFATDGGVGWELMFNDSGGARMEDVNDYLSAMRIEEIAEGERTAGPAMVK